MEKRGQVTIFIIIAILVIVLVAGFFLFRGQLGLEGIFTPKGDEVYLFVEDCVEGTANKLVYRIGTGGGYYFPPNKSTASGIPYYFFESKNYMPSKGDVENELSFYLSEELFFCTRNFVDFPDLEIDQGEIKTETKIQDNEIIFNVEYPLSITKGESITVIKDFKNIKIPVRLGIVYDSIEEIMEEQVSHDSICLSCILDVSLENDLYVDMLDYDEETVMFVFRDENSKINDVAFAWVFANKYEVENEN